MTVSATLAVVLAVLAWGLWGLFSKLALRTVPPGLVQMTTSAVSFLLGLGLLLAQPGAARVVDGVGRSAPGMGWALAAAGANGVAFVAYFTALRQREVSVVAALTATYPAVTCLLAVVFLGERLSLSRAGGLGLVLVGSYLLAR